jgi:putative addiction module killer protein
VDATPRTLRYYQTALGVEPCDQWLNELRDKKGRGIIRVRLNRIATGNFGNCEPVGDGVQELKIDFGPGYRVYFGVDGELLILLTGGDKDSQVKDIAVAKEYWLDYNA